MTCYATWIFCLNSPVILSWNDRHVSEHNFIEHICIALTPFIVITPPLIRARDIYFRHKRQRSLYHTAFARNLITGIVSRVPSHLTNNCALIADQPLIVNFIINSMTVCNDAVGELGARCLAVDATTKMRGGRQNAMRRKHSRFWCTRPNDIFAKQLTIWKFCQSGHRGPNHTLIAYHD